MIPKDDPRYLRFPNVTASDPEGFLAHGGDLEPETLLSAYQQGIFPWFNEGQPILWWSPDPRLILKTNEMKCSRSFKKRLRKNEYRISYDEAFSDVINACASPRKKQLGETWLSIEMRQAYEKLYKLQYAHSIECWQNDKLVGGLYGISINGLFFGESMFSTANDASKVALYYLCQFLYTEKVLWIDCQVESSHLLSLGAQHITRGQFIKKIEISLNKTLPIQWYRFAEVVKSIKL